MKAQEVGYGVQIGGRPIRTELATARSTGYFRRLDGKMIEAAELRQVFHGYDLTKAWCPTDSDKAWFNLNDGCFVHFGSHDEFKRAVKVSTSSLLPLQILTLSTRNKLTHVRLSLIHRSITSTLSSLKLVKDITGPTFQVTLQPRLERTSPNSHTVTQPLESKTIVTYTHRKFSLLISFQATTISINKSLHSSTIPTTISPPRSATK